MDDYKYLLNIREIDPNNDFLKYIIDRVNSDDYRGVQASQHNRLTFDYFQTLMTSIFEIAGNSKFNIHVGDDEGVKQPGAELYYDLVSLVKTTSGKGTVNSIKKNTFPDIARMGFLLRFDNEDNLIDENNSRFSVISVQLSKLGIDFVNASPFVQMKLFTDGIDKLTGNIASELFELLHLNTFGIDYINILEFMYIFSDDRVGFSFNDKLRYLLDYRKLSPNQKSNLDINLKLYCNPANRRKNANKVLLRDYHNWKNESQQIFGLFSNSTYFKVAGENLVLNNGTLSLLSQDVSRSSSSKFQYFQNHSVAKDDKFALHHIVPFSKALNQSDLVSIDDYKNLIYLENKKHQEFSSRGNINVRLSFNPSQSYLVFLDFNDIPIIVNLLTEVRLNLSLIPPMKDHNDFLLRKFYQFNS